MKGFQAVSPPPRKDSKSPNRLVKRSQPQNATNCIRGTTREMDYSHPSSIFLLHSRLSSLISFRCNGLSPRALAATDGRRPSQQRFPLRFPLVATISERRQRLSPRNTCRLRPTEHHDRKQPRPLLGARHRSRRTDLALPDTRSRPPGALRQRSTMGIPSRWRSPTTKRQPQASSGGPAGRRELGENLDNCWIVGFGGQARIRHERRLDPFR